MEINPVLIAVIGALGGLGGLIAGVVGAYVALRTLKPNVKILNSQEKNNLANAAESISGALNEVVTSFGAERKEWEEKIAEVRDERDQLEKRVGELEDHREKRTEQLEEQDNKINDLTLQIESLNREYLRQIQTLHEENASLKNHVTELEAKYSNSKEVIEELLALLEEKGVVELPPRLLSMLGDSIKGWKWPPGKKPT